MWGLSAHVAVDMPPSACLAMLQILQVASTEGIEIGQWVRFYALAASPARRRLAQAASGSGQNSTSAGGVSAAAAATGPRPLPPALKRAMESARQYYEAETSPSGVSSAAQAGTLDAVRLLGWTVRSSQA